jgi:pimeloyl-ACP methyl ester carboxylesterase
VRRLVTAAAALLVVAGAAAPARAADQVTPEGAPVPQLRWHDCHDGFECAAADVPRDYAWPRGATVRLALIRHRALDPEHRIGTLFVNPGGPGFSGVQFVRDTPPPAFAALSRFDWVGFDPRGVGDSRPSVDCDELDAPLQPMTPDTFDLRRLLRRAQALSKLCLNRDPAFLASLTTANVARDLDVLRAAVGDARLSYVGFSYGGMLGQTYASLFPGRARALVLDSTVDPDVWLNRPLQASIEQGVGFEDALDRFFAACAAHQPTCGFGGGDPEQALDDLLQRLDAAPLPAGDDRRIDGDAVRAVTAESLYAKSRWEPLAAALAGLQTGDPGPFRALEATLLGPDRDVLYDRFETYGSVERRFPKHVGPYLPYAEQLFDVAPHFATVSDPPAYEAASEAFWPIRPRGAFYGPFRNPPGAAPALVLQSTHDPATP